MNKADKFFRVVTFTDGAIHISQPRGLAVASAPIRKEDWSEGIGANMSYEILSAAEMETLLGPDCKLVNLYRTADGKLANDPTREHVLMDKSTIRDKYRRRVVAQMREEMATDSPDPIKLAQLACEGIGAVDLTLLETYKVALDSLKYADMPKPIIEEKLRAKIAELEAAV